MKDESLLRLKQSVLIPITLTAIMWGILLLEELFNISFSNYGLLPRSTEGIKGIFLYPFLHGSIMHLSSNSIPFMLLMAMILYFYKESGFRAVLFIYVVSGGLLWCFGREARHIGASGLVYGFFAFLFFSGVFKRDMKSITLALLVIFLYGGIVWGILPVDNRVSWEGHLFGALSGGIAAYLFRGYDKPKKYDWEDDDEEIRPEDLKIKW